MNIPCDASSRTVCHVCLTDYHSVWCHNVYLNVCVCPTVCWRLVGGGTIAICERNTRFLRALTTSAAVSNATPITRSTGNVVAGHSINRSTSVPMKTPTLSKWAPGETLPAEWLDSTCTTMKASRLRNSRIKNDTLGCEQKTNPPMSKPIQWVTCLEWLDTVLPSMQFSHPSW